MVEEPPARQGSYSRFFEQYGWFGAFIFLGALGGWLFHIRWLLEIMSKSLGK